MNYDEEICRRLISEMRSLLPPSLPHSPVVVNFGGTADDHLSRQLAAQGIDHVLHFSDSRLLRSHCMEHGLMPDALVSRGAIAHIYCLDEFFSDLFSVAPTLPMLFTTNANPYNIRLVNRLRRTMRKDEINFRQLRRDYIAQQFPSLEPSELDYWADNTRGLVYSDILRAVQSHSPNLLRDPYNTCHPETGRWSQRILSFEEYRGLVQPYGSDVTIENGFYDDTSRRMGRESRHFLNRLLRHPSFTALAPFIFIKICGR